MTELLAAAARLEAVLLAENAALEAWDVPAMSALLHEKLAASRSLADAASAKPPRTPAAAAMALRLRDLAQENRRLLDRAIDVQGRVMTLVASAAREAGLHALSRYGHTGHPKPDRNAIAILTRV